MIARAARHSLICVKNEAPQRGQYFSSQNRLASEPLGGSSGTSRPIPQNRAFAV
jgi:hypothetical protein